MLDIEVQTGNFSSSSSEEKNVDWIRFSILIEKFIFSQTLRDFFIMNS